MTTFVLASASPARLATLRSAGLDPVVVVSGVDESQLDGLPPAELALQLAELKCAAVAGARRPARRPRWCSAATRCSSSTARRSASPTTPTRRSAAGSAMRGRSGVLRTGHCLRDTATGRVAAATASTTVHFADVDDDEIAAYVATGEPLWVAGAFTVDGLGGAFVARHRGRPPQRGRGEPAAAQGAGGRAGPRVDVAVGAAGSLTAGLGATGPPVPRRRLVQVRQLPAADRKMNDAEEVEPRRPGRGRARSRWRRGCPRSGRRGRARCG